MKRIKPSKPLAAFSAVFAIGMGVWAWTQLGVDETGFLYLWTALLVAMVGFILWSAFSKNGALYTINRKGKDDETG